MSREQILAQKLLDIEAVALSPNDPFTWTSGIQSPIYCDNRLTLSYPELRKEIAKEFCRLIELHFPEAQVIAGTATAGIPHAAWIADLLNLPMVYVRSSSKGHGKKNQIEGLVGVGEKVVVVEDLISTGKSSIAAALALKNAGCEVLGVVSIFTYDMKDSKEQFEKESIPYYSLTNFSSLIEVATKNGTISENDRDFVLKWKENPKEWNK